MNIEHLKVNTHGASASWTAAVLCRFSADGTASESARGLAQSKTWRLAEHLPSCITIALMALVSAVQAANPPASLVMIPPQINYQGRLTTPANAPYNDTTHTIDLVLYPTASGGAKIWGERYAVQTRDGYFSVNLGSGGSQIPGVTNPPIWQVLWKADGASPDNFFMALTVRTAPDGSATTPVESTPRQQFLTAPFAYRAHQSVYATKADGLFSAAEGVQTPTLTNTTEVSIGAPTRVNIASPARVNVASPNFEINGRPMFIQTVQGTSGNTRTFTIPSGISTTFYNVVIAGWSCSTFSPAIQAVNINPFTPGTANVSFATTPSSSISVTVYFLGIAKEAF